MSSGERQNASSCSSKGRDVPATNLSFGKLEVVTGTGCVSERLYGEEYLRGTHGESPKFKVWILDAP